MKHTFDTILARLLHRGRLPFRHTKKEAWERVEARIEEAEVLPMFTGRPARRVWAVAAGFALLLAGAAVLYQLTHEVYYINPAPAAMQVELPDGSMSWLNQDAHIRYNRYAYSFQRNVAMEGEVFYEVLKGGAFTVSTPKGFVEVLGTSFNVRSNEDGMHVAVRTGKVKVREGQGAEAVLDPGTAVLLKGRSIEKATVSRTSVGQWVGFPYEFKDEAITMVFQQLSENTGYTIEWPYNIEARYTGKFEQNERIENMMAIVCKPLGLDYAIDHDKKLITILKK